MKKIYSQILSVQCWTKMFQAMMSLFFIFILASMVNAQTETVRTNPTWTGTPPTVYICTSVDVTVYVDNSTSGHTYRLLSFPGAVIIQDMPGNGSTISFTPLAFPTPGVFNYTVLDINDAVPTTNFYINVSAIPVAPTMTKTPNQTNVCDGTDVSAAINVAGSGGYSCSDTYEKSLSGGSWSSYTPGATISTTGQTTVAIRATRGGCGGSGCTSASNTYTWVVDPTSVGGDVTGGATVCYGINSTLLTLSGYTGTIVRWESSPDGNAPWTPITNTLTTYTATNLVSTTYFRGVVQSGVCNESNSTPAIITVNAFPTEVWVNGSFTSATPGWLCDRFATIQEGIDRLELGTGGNVYIAAGTYTEQLLVQGNINLFGAGIDEVIVKAPAGRTGTAPAFSAGSDFQADYILAAYPTTILTNRALTISVKVNNIIFDANNLAMVNGGRYPAVFFRNVYNETITDAGLFHCKVIGFAAGDPETSGIWAEDKCKLTIHGNTFNGFLEFGSNIYGMEAPVPPIVDVNFNTYNAEPQHGFASILYWFTTEGNIANNTIIGGENGIQINAATGATITENTISGVNYSGFAHTIDDVNAGNTGWAIAFYEAANNNTATGNTITTSDVGIENWNSTGNSVTGNKIYDNFYGLHNSTTTVMTATGNWWGNASGPYNLYNNTCGTGNPVSAYVNFMPWWTTNTGTDSGTPLVHNTTKNTYFCKIQDALDDAAAGNTIEVAEGTFHEHLVINKSGITLLGVHDAIVDGDNTGTVILITANNVTVQEMTVQNSGITTGDEGGIVIDGASGCNIIHNHVSNSLDGISLLGATSNTIQDNGLTANYYGIYLGEGASPSTGNTIHGNIIRATVATHLDGPNYDTGDGIYADEGSNGNIYTDNSVQNNGHNGFYFWRSSSNTTVSGNVVTGNTGSGFELYGSANNTISGNYLSANGYGFKLVYDAANAGSPNTITNNHIGGSISYGMFADPQIASVTADHNFWGNASGPHNHPYNTCGTGDEVVGNVSFLPWLTDQIGGTATLAIHNLTKTTWYCSIQDAIDDAGINNTIEVASGTYIGDLLIPATKTGLDLGTAPSATPILRGVATVPVASWPLVDPNIEILASGTKIHGFTIQAPDYAAGFYSSGMIIGATNVDVSYNTFQVYAGNDTPGDEIGQAIQTFYKGAVPGVDISGLNIHNNNFTNRNDGSWGFEGIYINLDEGTGPIAINYNEFYGDMVRAITVERSNADILENNIITDLPPMASPGGLEGICVRYAGPDPIVPQSNIDISGNLVKGSASGKGFLRGIRLGIAGETLSNFTVTANTVMGNTTGILVRSSANGVLVNNNKISGNTTGLTNEDALHVLDATDNWWGNVSGPYNNPNNTCGTGNPVSAYVSFVPWWSSETGGEGNQPVHNTTKDTYYCKIQDAIDDAAAGNTIVVAAGTFTEQLLIRKDLILTGAGIDQTIVKAPAGRTGTAPAFSAGSDFQADYILAAYPTTILTDRSLTISVKVEGITFDANNLAMVNGGRYPAVFFRNVFNSTILDAGLFHCKVMGFAAGDPETAGIWAEDKCKLTIHGNTFNDFLEFGTYIYGMEAPVPPVVDVSGNTYNAEPQHGFASIVYYFTSTGTITGNTIVGGENGIQLNAATNATITDNTISGVNYTEFAHTVQDVIDGNTGWAIAFYEGANNNTATGNDISTSDVGIENLNSTGNSVTGNKIYSNFYGLYNNTTTTMTATGNWWGHAEGPYNELNNSCGHGNPVSAYVNFNPWWTTTTGGTGTLAVNNTSKGTYYCTIQDAINDASDGNTIVVADGIYTLTDPVNIDKPVTLTGNVTTPANVVINAPSGLTYHSTGNQACFLVSADNVTIQGFTLQGSTDYFEDPYNTNGTFMQNWAIFIGYKFNGDAAGTYYNDIDNTTIKNNIIQHSSTGIHLYNNYGVTIENNTIQDMSLGYGGTQSGGRGIAIYNSPTGGPTGFDATTGNYSIMDNIIKDCDFAGITIDVNTVDGTGWVDLTGSKIDGNTIRDNWSDLGTGWGGAYTGLTGGFGIRGWELIQGLEIINNTIYNSFSSDHSFPGCGGIRISGSLDLVIGNNIIYGNERGVYLGGAAYVTTSPDITYNSIYSNYHGVYIAGNATDVAVSSNKIYSNTTTGMTNTAAAIVNAENNWWGDATGPYNMPNNTCGLGNAVSANVDFMPWWNTETGGSGSVAIYNATKGTYYCKIQDAINDAAAGNTINVPAGTYTEQLLIQKDLILNGAGSGTTTVKAPTSGLLTAPLYGPGYDETTGLGYILAAYPAAYGNSDPTISVKITGFTFDDNAQAGPGSRNTGIIFRKVANATIADAGLFNCTVNTFSDSETSGIWVMDGSKLTLNGNTFNDYIEYGVYVLGKYDGDNTDPWVTTSHTGFGNIGSGAASIVYRNTTQAGTIHENTIAAGMDGIEIMTSSNQTVDGNTISNCTSNGIILVDANSNTFTANIISNIHSADNSTPGACGWAIGLDGTSASNTIGTGLLADANDVSASDAGIIFYGAGTGNTAIGNLIHGNSPHGLNNIGGATVTATGNWWGSAKGPTSATLNPCGNGDALTDGAGVTFDPWKDDASFTNDVSQLIAYSVSGTISICTGGTATITLGNSQNGANYTYRLYRDGLLVGSIEPGDGGSLTWDVTEPATGSFTYTVTATNSLNTCVLDMTSSAVITVVAQPAPQTITKSPNVTEVCTEGQVSASFSGGSGGVSPVDHYESSIDGGASWLTYNSGDLLSSSITGTARIQVRTWRTSASSGCAMSGYNTVSWDVLAQPVQQNITKNPDVTEVCTNGTVSATFTGGSGGVSPVDHYEYSIDGGGTWSAYTPGSSISSSNTGVARIQIRTWRTSAGTGCQTSGYNTVNWNVIAQPAAQTVTKSPNVTEICTNGEVSATFSGGSGGISPVDHYESSINGGSTWQAYTPGATLSSSVTGVARIRVRTWRTSSGTGCNTSGYNTVTWDVLAQPAPQTITKTPNLSAVCALDYASATFSAGSGGVSPADHYESSVDAGNTWQTYTPGANLSTSVVGAAQIRVRTWRTSSGTGCQTSGYNVASWDVNPLPTPSLSGPLSVCAASAGHVYTTTNVSGHAYLWTVIGGNITFGQGTNSITVTWGTGASGTVTVAEFIQATTCTATDTKTVTIVALPAPTVSGPTAAIVNTSGVYSTTNVPGYAYSWSVTGGVIQGAGNQPSVTILWGNTPGTGTVSVTELNITSGCIGYSAPYYVTISAAGVKISGYYTYFNAANTPLDGVTLQLKQGSTTVSTTTTSLTGYYEFTGVSNNTYSINAITTKPEGGVNVTDAGQVNIWWGAHPAIERVKYNSGEVNLSGSINSTDAGAISSHFVNGTPFTAGIWTFWVQPDVSSSNPPAGVATFAVSGSDVTRNYCGRCVGDFNGNYIPAAGTKSGDAISSMLLTYDGTRKVGANEEFELPVLATSNIQVGAISMIMNFPANLVTVEDVYLKDGSAGVSEDVLSFNVKGNELRIGWSSLTPLALNQAEALITIKMKTSAYFSNGQSIQVSLSADPLNELADGYLEPIPDVVLSTNTIEFSTTGIGENDQNNVTLMNYPNPFTEFTMISYTLPVEGQVTIEIVNMMGEQVAVLVNGTQASGKYLVKLDAAHLTPGVYTATLRLNSKGDIMHRTIKLVHGAK